jgi:hypothetical protein
VLPLLPDMLRRCAAPLAASPSKELARSTSNRRRSRGYLTGNWAPPPLIPLPPALLWPRCPPRWTQGEPPVLLDPSPLRLPRHSAIPGRPSPVPGSWLAWAVAKPT